MEDALYYRLNFQLHLYKLANLAIVIPLHARKAKNRTGAPTKRPSSPSCSPA
jgi:hypothetical protein